MVVLGDKVNDNWENGKKGYKFFGYKNGEIMPYIYIFLVIRLILCIPIGCPI
jgi:hypothetical protein